MAKWILGLLALLLAGAGAYQLLRGSNASPEAQVRFGKVARGTLSVTVAATGQLQPVTQVDVGTQVSGTLQEIFVDFNTRVSAGQVLARLNTDNLEARVANNHANLKRALASHERLEVERKNAARQLERLEELQGRGVVSETEFDAAQLAFDAAVAALKVSDAEIEQARTTLRQSEIDLAHATIASPIDGIVIERAVEVGQTVAASFNSPLLFRIANDLTQMQIRASIDEADIGRVQDSRSASFTVDAFPGLTFGAALESVRLNPTVSNNVVIYTCIFRVENAGEDGAPGPLLPGLTANLTILVDRREDAILAPAAALRFQPKGEIAGIAAAGAPRRGERVGNELDSLMWARGNGGALRPVPVKAGITDGVHVEIVAGEVVPDDEVAVGQAVQDAGSTGTFSPFGGARPTRRGGGGR
ncbi:MAG: efflux RND transporter periplasmic adaptor subunit [Planctomycetes bacterium]|nr:efflux RND transporter periplasmic adaptor subunit [Planctomycetota bacterium]